MEFRGIYTPAITPLHDDMTINREGVADVLEHLIAEGVDGIILAGTTGEYYAHSMEERVDLLKFGCQVINGRVPVVGGTGAMRTEDSIFLAGQAKAAGCDAILVATPPYSLPTGRENALHALAVERSVDMPVMLYNYPGRMGSMMDEDFLDRVGQSSNFKAIKESSGDINRVHLLARQYPHIALSCGMDDQALEFFAWGAQSWVCAASNFAMGAHKALYRACVEEGDYTKGRRIMTAMLPLMTVLEQGGKFIQNIKHGMTLRGLPAGKPRLPLKPLNKDEKRDLAQVVATMNTTINQIEEEARS